MVPPKNRKNQVETPTSPDGNYSRIQRNKWMIWQIYAERLDQYSIANNIPEKEKGIFIFNSDRECRLHVS